VDAAIRRAMLMIATLPRTRSRCGTQAIARVFNGLPRDLDRLPSRTNPCH